MYKFYNANSHGNFVNDCVVRAISLVECKRWADTHKELSNLAQQQGILLDDVEFVERYLDDKYQRIKHKSKFIGELCEEFPDKRLLVTMNGHITAIINGILYDTFDCRDRIIWDVWEVPSCEDYCVNNTQLEE